MPKEMNDDYESLFVVVDNNMEKHWFLFHYLSSSEIPDFNG